MAVTTFELSLSTNGRHNTSSGHASGPVLVKGCESRFSVETIRLCTPGYYREGGESLIWDTQEGARSRLSEIVEDVESTGVKTIITKHGRPTAVIVGHEEYESLIETLNILSDSDTMAAIEEAEADLAAGNLVPLD